MAFKEGVLFSWRLAYRRQIHTPFGEVEFGGWLQEFALTSQTSPLIIFTLTVWPYYTRHPGPQQFGAEVLNKRPYLTSGQDNRTKNRPANGPSNCGK